MDIRKSLLIICLIICLFTISSACASDVNDTSIIGEDDVGIELTTTQNNLEIIDDYEINGGEMLSASDDEIVTAENDLDILRGDTATFRTLTDEIIFGQNVTLEHQYYVYEDGDPNRPIDIIKPDIVIDGNGAVIDMAGSNFYVFNVHGAGVTIKNLTIKNANFNNRGAAICWDGNGGRVSNCTFINNTALFGGAIYWNGEAGSVSGCTFMNNNASEAGAIFWNGEAGSVSGCTFMNNTAYLGGAIFWNAETGSVSGCTFMNNTADSGGAIYWYGEAGRVSDCTFMRNTARNFGGAIYAASNLDADYCWFGNNATDYSGQPPITENVSCNYRLFLNATANPDKIVSPDPSEIIFKLYLYNSTSGNISDYDNTPFKNLNLTVNATMGNVANTAKLGEPIQFIQTLSGIANITAAVENVVCTLQLEIEYGTTFYDLNYKINGNGKNTVTLDNDYMFDPSIDNDFKEGIIINRPVTIIGNNHTINATGQARIFNIQSDNVTIINVTFINANATAGGAIYVNAANCTVSDCVFANNTADGSGGAVVCLGDGNTVSDCVFANNTAGGTGGAVVCLGDGNTVSGCSFANNSALNGGAILWGGSDGNLSGCSFANNSAFGSGGAIVWDGRDGVVSSCTFENNSANDDGGAIVWDGVNHNFYNGNVSGCSFSNNHANRDGGAIFLNDGSGGIVSGCSFVNNSVDNEGGAIAWVRSYNGAVSGCSFVNNSANYGGAIDWRLNDGGFVFGCSFVNNSANYGGAIFWDRSGNGNVSSSIFINNSDGRGAIYVYNMGGSYSLAINGNIFLNNSARAISFAMNDSSANADYNWFGHNATNYNTEPVPSDTTINNWLFLNGTADPIVFFESGDVFFKLYSYNSTGIAYYDNSRLYPVNLTVTATSKGEAGSTVKLGESIRYEPTEVGTGSISVKFENVECTVEINNLKANSNLTVGLHEVIYSNNTIICLNYSSIATGKVNITLKGKKSEYEFSNLDLNATISLGSVDVGEYDIIVDYSGDGFFTNATAIGILSVDKVDSILTVGDVTLDYGTSSTLTVTTEGALGISARINENEVFIKGNIISIPVLVVGTYNLTVTTMPDVNHNAVTKTATITVNKVKTQIVANAMTTTYNINKDLVVTLKDSKGKALSGVKVTVNLNGVKTLKTDNNGQIKVSAKGLVPKAYTAKITFSGDENHIKSTKNVKVTVKKAKPKIIAKKKTFKKAKKVKKYKITLKDNIGKPIKKAKVTLKIKKKTFKAKTNAKGKATFKIKKLTKKGTFKGKITFKGNAYYNKVTKKVKIKMK